MFKADKRLPGVTTPVIGQASDEYLPPISEPEKFSRERSNEEEAMHQKLQSILAE